MRDKKFKKMLCLPKHRERRITGSPLRRQGEGDAGRGP